MEGNKEEQFEDIVDGDAGKFLNTFAISFFCCIILPWISPLYNLGIDLFDEDEFEIKASGQDAGDDKFDMYVGVLQEILLEPQFEKMTK